MKRASTLFLKISVFVMGLPALAICVVSAVSLFQEPIDPFPGKLYAIVIGFFAATIPYYVALYQAFKLLSYIDKNIAFSELSVQALKKIKYCGISIGIIFVAMEPVLYIMAQHMDAPGIILLGLIVAFASFVIAVFGAVLERLLQDAINLKSENELTV
ncbi:DUF2975 domain-containing protein [Paenibacillus sp. ACRRX]|uniref:DUF2975 domain-containing protein n=1 Tax=Paenibacillus sp. ACRRX TaxID=2918206 RepID=UPI001EF4CB5D|nr:DUF2975 domain-containing protein [Paenibacillus sp. ACRRX]MCG7406570.1 DUF2975 domain-containing protein [Paenibacillus sp. ACRRX]